MPVRVTGICFDNFAMLSYNAGNVGNKIPGNNIPL
jgi:hypothetical protein